MTELSALLGDCGALGIRFFSTGTDRLTIDAPKEALTPDLLGRLEAHKPELLDFCRGKEDCPGINPTNAGAVWHLAMDRLVGDPLFPPDLIEALRAADAQWRHDAPREPTIDPAPTVFGPDGWPSGSVDPDELSPCPTCGTLELWQSLAGNWRCQCCDPPTVLAVQDVIRHALKWTPSEPRDASKQSHVTQVSNGDPMR